MNKQPHVDRSSRLHVKASAVASTMLMADLPDSTRNHDGLLAEDYLSLLVAGHPHGAAAYMASKFAMEHLERAVHRDVAAEGAIPSCEALARHFQIMARNMALADRAFRTAIMKGLISC